MTGTALTVPNIITVLRFIAVPIIVYLMLIDSWSAAFWLFVAAGISDGVDGIIARRFNQQSEIGAYLDPIADKMLLVAVFVILAVNSTIPLWIVLLMVARDILIIIAVIISSVMGAELKIAPIMVSKATTVAQIALAAYVFAAQAWVFDTGIVGQILIYSTAALTLASAAAYAVLWFNHMAEHGET